MIEQRTGEKIKTLRLAQNLTQEELALYSAITVKYLSLIETGQREASIHVYKCIADALNIPMWQIFCNLSEETMLALKHFDGCSEMEIRALRRFIDGNKHALRQCLNMDF
jgi:transcriptional regulator with XRE-family HTH domain